MFSRICALAIGLGLARPAAAAPDVLLREVSGLRPGLCDALRIQLTGLGVVACDIDAPLASTEARIAALSAVVKHAKAQLGAFLIADANLGTVQLVLVGAEQDSALIRFEPIRDRPEPDVDRSLALKISDALDVLRRTEASAVLQTPSLAAALVPHAAHVNRQSVWSGLLEAGYGLELGSFAQAKGSAAIGVRRGTARHALEAALSGFVTSSAREHGEVGTVDTRAFGGAVSLRALRRLGRVELGAYAACSVARYHALGQASSGQSGRGDLNAAALGAGLDARISLFSSAYVRFYPGFTWLPVAPQFALDNDVTFRVGHVRVELPLALGVRTP